MSRPNIKLLALEFLFLPICCVLRGCRSIGLRYDDGPPELNRACCSTYFAYALSFSRIIQLLGTNQHWL